MGISALSMANYANTKYHMSLSGRGPDWSIIPSSGKSSKSKAEFTDEIKELARRAANTTNKCYNFASAFEKAFGSLRCFELRPTGFSENDPPHMCENLTCDGIEFAYQYILQVTKQYHQ